LKAVVAVWLKRQVFLIPCQQPEGGAENIKGNDLLRILKEYFPELRMHRNLQVIIADAVIKQDAVRNNPGKSLKVLIRIINTRSLKHREFDYIRNKAHLQPQAIGKQCF
jgi:hypothetical protein